MPPFFKFKYKIMAKIAALKGKNGTNVYPGTIPQAVVDPFTKKTLRNELDELYEETIVIDEENDSTDVESTSADTATKALKDWDGNDIRSTYLKDAPKDSKQYARKNGVWEEIPKAVTVDSSMSSTSTNPVQNKVVKSYIDGLFDVVTEAEYLALGSVVNTNGVIYFITE